MEGCFLDYLFNPKTVLDNLLFVNQYTQNTDDVQRVLYSHFSDIAKQNSITSIENINTMFELIFDVCHML